MQPQHLAKKCQECGALFSPSFPSSFLFLNSAFGGVGASGSFLPSGLGSSVLAAVESGLTLLQGVGGQLGGVCVRQI